MITVEDLRKFQDEMNARVDSVTSERFPEQIIIPFPDGLDDFFEKMRIENLMT